jgi:hypothetical protein
MEVLNDEQRHLVQTIVCACSGIPVVDYIFPEIDNMETILNLRMSHAALHVHGAQIQLGDQEKIWAIQRYSMDMGQSLLCLANFSTEAQGITFAEDDLTTGQIWKDVLTNEEFTAGEHWVLQSYQAMVLVLA